MRIRIEQDTDPLDPREHFDHLGTMVCFHNVLNSYQLEYDRVQRELGDALTRVREKQESLREIGKACALIKNTAHGDFIMLPGGEKLEVMVTEGLKK